MLTANYIDDLLKVVMEVAKGNYDIEIPLSGDNDEFDALAMGINIMIDELKSRKELEAANKEMKKAKEQAELAKKIKEQFMANMSHEIRTPMNAIVGMTDILLDQQPTPDQKKCIEAIKVSADNLLTIINEVLDFSKIEAGKITFEKAPFHLEEALESIIQTLQFTASSKNLSLTYSISNNTPTLIVGDVSKLRQVLINLASNSIKFTESGRIKIEVFSQKLNQDDYWLEFSISDTGIGIPEEKIDSVFESFTQASNDTTRKYGGTGLGLAIVKNLIELQGGKVSVKSKINEGTTFTFSLAFKKVDTITKEIVEQKSELKNDLKNAKVLLVEDNAINRFLAQTVLNKWNCTIQIAENGRIAVEKVSKETFDIILMDIQMPELDGYDAAREIRKLKLPMSAIPIIAMTAHAMEGEADKCKSAGMNDYISKPFNKNILYEKICSQLKIGNIEIGGGKNANIKPMETTKYINLDYLNTIADGSDVFVNEMLQMLSDEMPPLLEEMNLALNDKNWHRLNRIAHKLKPHFEMLGIQSVYDDIRSIEKFAFEQINLEQLPVLVNKVIATCQQALEELKNEYLQKKL